MYNVENTLDMEFTHVKLFRRISTRFNTLIDNNEATWQHGPGNILGNT